MLSFGKYKLLAYFVCVDFLLCMMTISAFMIYLQFIQECHFSRLLITCQLEQFYTIWTSTHSIVPFMFSREPRVPPPHHHLNTTTTLGSLLIEGRAETVGPTVLPLHLQCTSYPNALITLALFPGRSHLYLELQHWVACSTLGAR